MLYIHSARYRCLSVLFALLFPLHLYAQHDLMEAMKRLNEIKNEMGSKNQYEKTEEFKKRQIDSRNKIDEMTGKEYILLANPKWSRYDADMELITFELNVPAITETFEIKAGVGDAKFINTNQCCPVKTQRVSIG